MKTIINKIFEKERLKNIEKKIDKIYNDEFDYNVAPNLEEFEELIIKRTLLETKHKINLRLTKNN